MTPQLPWEAVGSREGEETPFLHNPAEVALKAALQLLALGGSECQEAANPQGRAPRLNNVGCPLAQTHEEACKKSQLLPRGPPPRGRPRLPSAHARTRQGQRVGRASPGSRSDL